MCHCTEISFQEANMHYSLQILGFSSYLAAMGGEVNRHSNTPKYWSCFWGIQIQSCYQYGCVIVIVYRMVWAVIVKKSQSLSLNFFWIGHSKWEVYQRLERYTASKLMHKLPESAKADYDACLMRNYLARSSIAFTVVGYWNLFQFLSLCTKSVLKWSSKSLPPPVAVAWRNWGNYLKRQSETMEALTLVGHMTSIHTVAHISFHLLAI